MSWLLVFTEQYEKRALRFLKCHPDLENSIIYSPAKEKKADYFLKADNLKS